VTGQPCLEVTEIFAILGRALDFAVSYSLYMYRVSGARDKSVELAPIGLVPNNHFPTRQPPSPLITQNRNSQVLRTPNYSRDSRGFGHSILWYWDSPLLWSFAKVRHTFVLFQPMSVDHCLLSSVTRYIASGPSQLLNTIAKVWGYSSMNNPRISTRWHSLVESKNLAGELR